MGSQRQVQVEVLDVVTGARVASFGRDDLVSGNGGVALSADGAWLATPGSRIGIWEMTVHKLLLALPDERSSVWALAWSPASRSVR